MFSKFDEYTPLPSLHVTATKLINDYPEIAENSADCIFLYFDKEFIYHQHYRYGDYNDLFNALMIRYWKKGHPAVTVCKGQGVNNTTFRIKDDKETHHVDFEHQFYLLKIHLPAFQSKGYWVYKHEIIPITDPNMIASLKAIREC